MLKHFISSTTGEYIKSEKLAVKMGYTTSQPLPDVKLAENEYVAMLDADGKVQYWPDDTGCTWQVKTRFEKVTAYNKQTQQPKEFDDKSLVDDEHTLNKPLPHSICQANDWVQQVDLLQVAKRNEINQWRHTQEANTDEIVTENGIEWDANPLARSRIESTLSSDYLPPFWTDANDVDQPITLDVLKAVHTAIVKRGFEIHARQREMKAEIEQITDFATIEDYPIGWPE